MQSSGGVASAAQVVKKPITTALSVLRQALSEVRLSPNLPASRSCDARRGRHIDGLLLIEGANRNSQWRSVGQFPVRIPMIDIATIGIGGGSIAWISREGHLKVGPRSAGAEPGPMCYPKRRQ